MNDATTIARRLGLALDSVDHASFERVRKRTADPTALTEALLVHETWFFRDPPVFAALAQEVRDRRAPLRVLSAPCSTGEEPYSAAIALLEAGLPPGSFEVLGVDASEPALAAARAGRFAEHAFRRGPDPRGSWLRPEPDGTWRVTEALRSCVRFRRANLTLPSALEDELPFDAVLCRNLWIYLTPDARVRLEQVLGRVLATDGALFVGHAEAPAKPFIRRGSPEQLMFRKEPCT